MAVMPSSTTSARRTRSAGPNRLACVTIRAASSSGGLDQAARRGIGHRPHDDEVAETLEQVGEEPPRIVPGVHDLVEGGEDTGTVAGGDGVDDLIEQCGVGEPEQGDREIVGDPVVAGSRR